MIEVTFRDLDHVEQEIGCWNVKVVPRKEECVVIGQRSFTVFLVEHFIESSKILVTLRAIP